MDNEKANKARFIKITALTMLFILILILLSACLIIHSYIARMNLVADADVKPPITEEDIKLAPEPENNTGSEDASEAEIKSLEEEIRKNMEDQSAEAVSNQEVLNILLIGSDSRRTGGTGRSDAMILISINKETDKIVATSILRDIYLYIPDRGCNRINAAYAYGGAELLMDTIEDNFKLKVDRYACVDFYSFIDVIDALGGITIDVKKEEIPIINDYIMELNGLTGQEASQDLLTKEGTLLLNGKQTLGYVRNRYIGTDFERTDRQRKVLEQVFAKVKASNLIEINDLLNIILPLVTTNLSEGEIFSMILKLPVYKDYELEQWSIPIKDSYAFMRIRGMSVIGIDFNKNREEMIKKIYAIHSA